MDEKKVREAIERMRKMRDAYNATLRSLPQKTRERSDYNNYVDAFLVAIEALEKQLPKKVEIKEWSPAICPSCGYELSEDLGDGYYRHPKFLERCPNPDCGQRLDWSE